MNWYARWRILGVSILMVWVWVLYFTETVIHLGLSDWCENTFGSWNGIGIWAITWLAVVVMIFRGVVVFFARR